MISRHGFTLVELLIVIVVIAILAAVSVVAYNGIQERADDSKAAYAASTYAKAIRMYITDGGQLPAGNPSCLGDPSHCPATGNFQAEECYVGTRNGQRLDSGYKILYNSSISSQLDAYLTTIPSVDFPDVNFSYTNGNGQNISGVYYNGNNHVVYILKGNKSCPSASFDQEAGITWCYHRFR
jgi:prepilin-type N-terminal cleavage/methylation domain-containing protein